MPDKPASDREYSISELEEVSGTPRRTVHYYIARELLPPAEGSGLGARYGEVHLLRLRVIELLKKLGLKLESIRGALDSMTTEELRETCAEAEKHPSKAVYRLQQAMAHHTLLGIMDGLAEQETVEVRAAPPGVRAGVGVGAGMGEEAAEDESDEAVGPSEASGASGIGGLESTMPLYGAAQEPRALSRKIRGAGKDRTAAEPPAAEKSPSPALDEPTTWRRMQVTPDLEIHYRAGRDSRFTTKLKAVVGLIRGMFAGDDDPAPPGRSPKEAGKKGGKKKDPGKKNKKKKG